ncbi:MAG: hypothetical protein EOP43_05775 [Sphingobacteriaceae bacterium]|nr:MAG: hypothetical protein EOP43_05775 [Sphingobacteriaceae bacterium]
MKTSNKLLIVAILIIIVSMVTYDFALRAEYLKGDYKSRFYNMKSLDLKNFKTVDNRVANLVEVNIEKGEKFAIWIDKDLKDNLNVSQNGTDLVIDIADKKNLKNKNYNGKISIICPSIDKVSTSPFFYEKANVIEYEPNSTCNIKGFNQQDLTLIINKSTHLSFGKNQIENLKATVGDDKSKYAYLFIASTNKIDDAAIKVAGKNQLSIENAKIGKSNFTISDSAQVSLSGSFLNKLIQQ